MYPRRNEQSICKVCFREMSQDGELILHREFPQTPRGIESSAAVSVQISNDEGQIEPDPLASTNQILQSTQREISAANGPTRLQSTLLPPSRGSEDVESISTNIALYQAIYKEAAEASLIAIRVTQSSIHLVQRAIQIAATCSSERMILSKKAQKLYDAIKDGSRRGMCVERMYSEYSKILEVLRVIYTKEHEAQYYLRRAIFDQENAFDSMIKAADRKHDAFTIAYRYFFKMEAEMDAKNLKKNLIFDR